MDGTLNTAVFQRPASIGGRPTMLRTISPAPERIGDSEVTAVGFLHSQRRLAIRRLESMGCQKTCIRVALATVESASLRPSEAHSQESM